MKILFHIPFPAVGGAETQIQYLVKYLSPGVHPIVTYEYPEVEAFVKGLPRVKAYRVYSPMNLAKTIDQVRPDVIHFYHSHTMYAALKKARHRPRTCEIVHNRMGFGGDSTSYGKDLTDIVVCVSPDAETYFKSKMPAVKTRVIPNGVDTDIFRPSPPKARRAIPKGGFTGRLEAGWGKGIPELINLFIGQPAEFELVGVDYGGFRKKLKDDGITNIKVRDYTPETVRYYHDWDFFVSYSPSEGFGLSIAEALACGLPTLVFDCGGVCHYIENEKHAFIAKNDEGMRAYLPRLWGEEGKKLEPLTLDLSAEKMARSYEELWVDLTLGRIKRSEAPPRTGRAVKAPLTEAILGVTTQDWWGVRRALDGVCTHYSTPQDAVRTIRSLRPRVVVFGCYQMAWENVLQAAKAEGCKTVLTWHASYILNEFNHINREWMFHGLKAAQAGHFDFVATPHEGLAKTWSHYGIEADFLPNVVTARLGLQPKLDGFHVGVFGSGQPWKNMDAQIIGADMAGAEVHIQAIQHPQSLESLSITPKRHSRLANDEAYYRLVGSMKINLCMSLSEVYSYLTAESLLMGVPILTTPITPVLKEAPEILQLCRNPHFEDPHEIAVSLRCIMENHEAISKAGVEHMTALNELNREIAARVRAKWLE
jgi:glycosyltransferase involved in cell wall biosynthesis